MAFTGAFDVLAAHNINLLRKHFGKIQLVEHSIRTRIPLESYIADFPQQSELERRLLASLWTIGSVRDHLIAELERFRKSSDEGSDVSLQHLSATMVPLALRLDYAQGTRYTAVDSPDKFAALVRVVHRLELDVSNIISLEYSRIEIAKRRLKDGCSSNERDEGVRKLSHIQQDLATAYKIISSKDIKANINSVPLMLLREQFKRLPTPFISSSATPPPPPP